MSRPELLTLVSELRRRVRDFSEVLVRELAHRDELDYEKELRNQFIWLLLRVHRRRRDQRLMMKSTDNDGGGTSRRGVGDSCRTSNGNGNGVNAVSSSVAAAEFISESFYWKEILPRYLFYGICFYV